ncbi:hypothetical protein MTO96_045137 [Rhipicephalus appendiculatus]
MYYLSTSWDSVTSETVSSFQKVRSSAAACIGGYKERSEDDPVACASDIDDDINEGVHLHSRRRCTLRRVKSDRATAIPTCEHKSVIVSRRWWGEAPEDSGENERRRTG